MPLGLRDQPDFEIDRTGRVAWVVASFISSPPYICSGKVE